MSLGDNIRLARNHKKLKQKELASILTAKGESARDTTISNWENGVSKPDADTIALLCEILEVDANFLLDFNKDVSKNEFDDEIERFATENGIQVILDKNAPLTANDVVEVNKKLMEIMTDQEKNK